MGQNNGINEGHREYHVTQMLRIGNGFITVIRSIGDMIILNIIMRNNIISY